MRKPRNTEDLKEFKIVERYKKKEISFCDPKIYGTLDVALIFPGPYHLAISSLGFNRVYEIINSVDGVNCERFCIEKSFQKYYSLDSSRPLDEFDIWAFSVSFEMDYFNIVNLFKKKNIPINSSERNNNHPLVMIGGAVTYFNARPLLPIADFIYHGDSEEILDGMFLHIRDCFEKRSSKSDILNNLLQFDNISVGGIRENLKINKNFSLVENPAKSLFISEFGDFGKKPLLEIGRGCIRNCNFCAAGSSRKPARFVKIEKIKEILEFYINNGIKDFGLISATATDYPFLEELLDYMEFTESTFSLSSLRLDSISDKLIKGLKRSGQKSLTIAPEGGSQKIRDVFNKNISEKDIENAFNMIRKHGLEEVKMYFIYGLEEENENDLLAFSEIVKLAESKGFRKISLSFNPLIPKPSTQFENREIQDLHILKDKQKFIKKSLSKNIKLKFESLKESQIQFNLATGDENTLIDIFE